MNERPDNEPADFESEPAPEAERPASEPELVSADLSPFAEPEGVWLQEGATTEDWLADADAPPFLEPDDGQIEDQ